MPAAAQVGHLEKICASQLACSVLLVFWVLTSIANKMGDVLEAARVQLRRIPRQTSSSSWTSSSNITPTRAQRESALGCWGPIESELLKNSGIGIGIKRVQLHRSDKKGAAEAAQVEQKATGKSPKLRARANCHFRHGHSVGHSCTRRLR